LRPQSASARRGNLDIKNEKRDGNGKYAIREGFDAGSFGAQWQSQWNVRESDVRTRTLVAEMGLRSGLLYARRNWADISSQSGEDTRATTLIFEVLAPEFIGGLEFECNFVQVAVECGFGIGDAGRSSQHPLAPRQLHVRTDRNIRARQ
jgi:hypothetical protein